jgi:ectoine hydroxylase-related dioxygenase (phytanoyl-CoA dioxygenase family)
MTADLRSKFESDGAVMLRGILSHEHIDMFAKQSDLFRIRYSDVQKGLEGCPARASSGVLAAWAELLEAKDWVLNVQLAPKVHQALEDILEDEPVGRWSHFVFQSPGTLPQFRDSAETAHVHNLGLDSDPRGKVIIGWTPVDDVSPDAGPMWIVPGSHKRFSQFSDELFAANPVLLNELQEMWRQGAPAEQWQAWTLRCEDRSKPIFSQFLSLSGNARQPVLLKKGDLLLFSPALLHGTCIARSPEIPRRAIISQYQAANCQLWEIGDGAGQHKNANGPGYYKFKEWEKTSHGLTDPTSRYRHYSSMKGYLH